MEDLMANDGKMDPSESISKNEMAGLGNEMPQSEQTTAVREVSLKIPVAVFTAKRGYDWTQLPDFVAQDEADALFERVMSLLSNYCVDLSVHDIFKGVIYEGKFAFAFCLQKAEKWDQANRNANYCACAFVKNECLADVDFERLLDNEYFTIPNHNPSAVLDYVDIDYIDPVLNDWEPIIFDLKAGLKRDFNWRLIGPMLSEAGVVNSHWIFMRMVSRGEFRFGCEFGQWKEECFPVKEEVTESECHDEENARTDDLGNGSVNSAEQCESLSAGDSSPRKEQGEVESIDLLVAEEETINLRSQLDALRNENAELLNRLNITTDRIEKQRKIIEDLQIKLESERRIAKVSTWNRTANPVVTLSKERSQGGMCIWLYVGSSFLVGAVLALLVVMIAQLCTLTTDVRSDELLSREQNAVKEVAAR